MLVIVWILPGEEGREAQAKPGWLPPPHCNMHLSAFAEAASSQGGITVIGGERSFVLKQGEQGDGPSRTPHSNPPEETPNSDSDALSSVLLAFAHPVAPPNHEGSTSFYHYQPPPLH